MSLAFTASAMLGNYRYDAHASAVTVRLSLLPGLSAFELSLPAGVDLPAAPGDPASLDLDGGELQRRRRGDRPILGHAEPAARGV